MTVVENLFETGTDTELAGDFGTAEKCLTADNVHSSENKLGSAGLLHKLTTVNLLHNAAGSADKWYVGCIIG